MKSFIITCISTIVMIIGACLVDKEIRYKFVDEEKTGFTILGWFCVILAGLTWIFLLFNQLWNII